MKRVFCLCTGMLIFLSGCTSVPRITGASRVEDEKYQEEEKYNIKIASDYRKNPAELKYAVNDFVKKLGETSYDIIIEKKGASTDYYVVMPGSTPVEDLPPVKHFHKGKTVAAIVAPIAGVGVVGVIIAYYVIMMLPWIVIFG